MQKKLEKYIANQDDSVHKFAVEVSKELTSTFAYMLDPKHKVIYCLQCMVYIHFKW